MAVLPSYEASATTSISDLSKAPLPASGQDEKEPQEVDVEGRTSGQSVPIEGGAELERELSRIDTSDYPSAFPLAMIVVALALSIFLVALDMTIVATAIPRITDQFHSLDQVGWYGSAFFLTIGSFQATWGKLYKYFPLKISYLASIIIFEVGSLICAVANDSTTLIVGRAVAGMGGAGIASGSYTIIAFSAPPKQRPAFTGVMGAVFGVASVIGPLLGGVFTDNLSWRWCFYINLPIGGVAAIIIFFFFHTPKAARPQAATLKEKLLQMDFPGTFTIMAAIVCYLLAMQWGGATKPWSDGSVIAVLVMFGVLVIAFGVIEYFQGDRALLQGRLLKDRTLAAMSAFIFMVAGSFFILLYYLPIYFQATRGVSAAKSGIDNLPLVLGASLFTIVSGGLLTVWGQYVPLMAFGAILASVGSGLIYTFEINTNSGKWIGYQALVGIGLGLIFQIPVIVGQAVVKPSDLSSVSAMILFWQTIGGAIFISAAQAGFTNKMVKELPIRAPGVNPALVLATGATDLRRVFPGDQIHGILSAYMEGLRVPVAICIACACVTFLLAFTPRWESIKGKVKLDAGAA
ncbi:MFS-type transporter grgE [Exophiala dermatitidis]